MEDEDITPSKIVPPQYLSIQPVTENLDDGLTPVVYMEYTPETRNLSMTDPANYMMMAKRKLTPNSVILSGHNTSIYNQLGELGKNLINGPYQLSGRDNKLTLKNSCANKKTVASYTYAGGNGELLEFEISTEHSTSTVEVTKSTDIDPDDKQLVTTTVQAMADTNAMYADGRVLWHTRDIRKPFTNPVDALYVAPKPVPWLISSKDSVPGKPAWETKSENAYANTKEATKDISENYQISEYDTEQYWEGLSNKFNAVKDPTTEADLDAMLRNLNTLDPYIIKKKVQVKTKVHPTSYGKKQPNVATDVYGYHSRPTPQAAAQENRRRWKEGYNYLSEDPTVTIIPKTVDRDYGGYSQGEDSIDILQEKEIEIPIPGARILASANFKNADIVMGNDMIKTTQNKVTASAKILGKPSLEEGMNIEINNVSSRYSGVWHIKAIKHTISDQGYFCDIEFIQKTIPISTNTISAKVNTQKAFAEINKVAQEALKTKSYKYTSEIAKTFLEWRKDNGKPDTQYLLRQDKSNPRKLVVYTAGNDFEPSNVQMPMPQTKVAELDIPLEDDGE